MKAAIIEFFKSNRTYHTGIILYMQYGISQSLRKQLNVQSYSRDLELMLFEQLRSMAEIDQETFRIMMITPVQIKATVVMEEPVDPLEIPVINTQVKEPEIPKETEPILPIVEPEPEPVVIIPETPM